MLPNVSFDEADSLLLTKAFADLSTSDAEALLEVLSIEKLQFTNRRFGSDYATALLYASLLNSTQHGPFIRDFYANCAPTLTREAITQGFYPDKVLIIPGAFYREYPETGAPGDVVMRELQLLGIPVERIPTLSIGTLQQNAEIVADFLSKDTGGRIAVISLSKGGADLKWALRNDLACLKQVDLWINIGGVLSGSPLINWVRDRPPIDWVNQLVFFLRKRDYRFFRQLARTPAGELDFQLNLPPHVHAVHVAGFPLSKHAKTKYASIWHKRFASIGPNDSVMLLEDMLHLPGKILPIWGVDHYYSPRWDFGMLIHGLLRYWNRTFHQTEC